MTKPTEEILNGKLHFLCSDVFLQTRTSFEDKQLEESEHN